MKRVALLLVGLALVGCQQQAEEVRCWKENDKEAKPPLCSPADHEANVPDRVWFAYDSSVLSEEAQETLDEQAAWLQRHPKITVTVEGHADERGTREYNIALGERRASVMKGYLVNSGIDAARLTIISYGKERPAEVGNMEEAWAKNRRAVLMMD